MVEERKLATIERVESVTPIPDADSIETVRVRGWDVVVKKGEFDPGDHCIYFEIDSMLDVSDSRFEFLAARGVRTDTDGNQGHVLKTARLRGQYSQGLVMPLYDFPETMDYWKDGTTPVVGTDVTELLGVKKWNPPIPVNLSGQVRGSLPSFVTKTDEERLQNIPEILEATGVKWFGTEKIDGSSTSVYWDFIENRFGVCSRNQDLIETKENTFWKMAREYDLEGYLKTEHWAPVLKSVVIQGETFGEGIQKNPLKIKGQQFAVFNLLINGMIVPRQNWPQGLLNISVPLLDLEFPQTLDAALHQADNLRSSINPEKAAEGIVWKADRPTVKLPDQRVTFDPDGGSFTHIIEGKHVKGSFKVISRKYLLKNDL